jgi:hypothetical protein
VAVGELIVETNADPSAAIAAFIDRAAVMTREPFASSEATSMSAEARSAASTASDKRGVGAGRYDGATFMARASFAVSSRPHE